MNIGAVHIAPPTVFAPLAGITNLPMRLMAKEAGCGLVCSEMVSANGLVYGSAKTAAFLDSSDAERPLSVQLFGSDWAILADAAQRVEAAGADIADINFGCSVRKILKSGSGSALMREPEKAEKILKAVRAAISIPLTIKMRSGWEPGGAQALALGRIAQECGADAVTIHPRTAKQGFGGTADWGIIERLKAELRIPVIGNGDIAAPEDALRMFEQTRCDAVMVGRAAFGNPFIFSRIDDLLAGRPPRNVTAGERIDLLRRYLDASVIYLGEKRACFMLRSRLGWFVKGLPGAARFRSAVRTIESHAQALKLIDGFSASLDRKVPGD
jgi:nifR3 family TIM-barrel protein